jgi:hypothetical protein
MEEEHLLLTFFPRFLDLIIVETKMWYVPKRKKDKKDRDKDNSIIL